MVKPLLFEWAMASQAVGSPLLMSTDKEYRKREGDPGEMDMDDSSKGTSEREERDARNKDQALQLQPTARVVISRGSIPYE